MWKVPRSGRCKVWWVAEELVQEREVAAERDEVRHGLEIVRLVVGQDSGEADRLPRTRYRIEHRAGVQPRQLVEAEERDRAELAGRIEHRVDLLRGGVGLERSLQLLTCLGRVAA